MRIIRCIGIRRSFAAFEADAFVIVAVRAAVFIVVDFVVADFGDFGRTVVEIDGAVRITGHFAGFKGCYPFAAAVLVEQE